MNKQEQEQQAIIAEISNNWGCWTGLLIAGFIILRLLGIIDWTWWLVPGIFFIMPLIGMALAAAFCSLVPENVDDPPFSESDDD